MAGPRKLVDGPRFTPALPPTGSSVPHLSTGAAVPVRPPVVGIGLIERMPTGAGRSTGGDAVPFGGQVHRSRDDREVRRVAAAPMRTGISSGAGSRVMADVVEHESGFTGRRFTVGTAPYLLMGLALPSLMAPLAVALGVHVAGPRPAGVRAAAAVDQIIERNGVRASGQSASDSRVAVTTPSVVVHPAPTAREDQLGASVEPAEVRVSAAHSQYYTAKGGQ